jgi:hypothetical protein
MSSSELQDLAASIAAVDPAVVEAFILELDPHLRSPWAQSCRRWVKNRLLAAGYEKLAEASLPGTVKQRTVFHAKRAAAVREIDLAKPSPEISPL